MNIFKCLYSRYLMIIGTVYSVFVYIIGSTCVGMHCIGLLLFSMPIIAGSLPWIFIAEIFPSVLGPKNQGLMDSPFLDPSTWTGLIIIYSGFMFNLWLLGKGIEWLVIRKKNKVHNETKS